MLQINVSNSFRYPIPKHFISGVVYKFQCSLCNESYYGKSNRHLDIRPEKHIGVSPLTEKRLNHQIMVLFVIIYSSFDYFSVLAHE